MSDLRDAVTGRRRQVRFLRWLHRTLMTGGALFRVAIAAVWL